MSVLHITNQNFEELVMKNDKPVLLDFFAPWCGPCRMVAPILDQIAKENPDIAVGKINVDEEEALAAKFGVMSIPALFVMKEGRITAQSLGARPKSQILAMIKE